MREVSNTSPILNLAIVDHLHLLREQMSEVFVPLKVIEELRLDEALPGVAVIKRALADGWLQVQPVTDLTLVRALSRDLDAGEAEAIALTLQIGADLLLLDERDARRVASSLKLKVTGVIGILLRAHHEGRVSALHPVLVALEDKAGFFVGKELRRQIEGRR